ncbi:membrane protein [Palaeococcus pacificus DY20341]|uniref:Membrane protein n=1 Tax=Palaeococcus pacificus DY20341 TaxID=1343739 RepID=A0A075LQW5_9EURY|nr:membrane protein [Palaeococcus pacificus]AIF68689.1 membrane protein [Palaeococcus pacificus DY20341]
MVVIDHYTLGYLTFAFMSLSMLSGAFIFLSKKREAWVKVHIILSILAYILMVLTIWYVR